MSRLYCAIYTSVQETVCREKIVVNDAKVFGYELCVGMVVGAVCRSWL